MGSFKTVAVSCLLLILAMSTIPHNISTTAQTIQTQYAEFPIQSYSYSGSLFVKDGIKYLSLPSNSLPMGIIYDNKTNKVWIALYWNRSIASVDVATLKVTIYPIAWFPRTLTVTPDGYIWISGSRLARLDFVNNMLFIFDISGIDVKYYNGFLWFLTYDALLKINYTSFEIVNYYPREHSAGGFMCKDGDYIWITDTDNNRVLRFNILSETFDLNLTGFDRPLGIEVDENYVYVAENVRRGEAGKIEVYEPVVAGQRWFIASIENPHPECVPKKGDKLWFNDIENPEYVYFENMTYINIGFNITVSSPFAYNHNKGTAVFVMGWITRINKTSPNPPYERLYTAPVTREGPYYVLKDSDGNLWWTDNSNHIGVKMFNGTDVVLNSISPYCYFMTEVPDGSIWASAVGSAYVEMVDVEEILTIDINKDGLIDIFDLVVVALAYSSKPGDPNWNPIADLNRDGIVDIYDIAKIAINFSLKYRW